MEEATNPPEDAALLAAARAGDRQALEALLERQQARIYRFGMRLCRDPEDAKDILQDTLIAMARGVRDFQGASSLSTWLFQVARSFCIKKRRRSKYAPEAIISDASAPDSPAAKVPDSSKPADEELGARQAHESVDRAIRSLEPEYREVMLLRDVEGLTAPEVAEILGLTVEAVKSRLHRARLAVRAQVAADLGVGDLQIKEGCPDTVLLFSRYLEGEINADLCTQMEQHLEKCDRCRGRCDSLKQTLTLCQASKGTEVPPGVQEAVRAAVRQFLAPAS